MHLDRSKDFVIDYSHMISLFDNNKDHINKSHLYDSSTSFLSMGNNNPIKDFMIRDNQNFKNSDPNLGFKIGVNTSKVRSAGPSPFSSPSRMEYDQIMTPSKEIVSSLVEVNTPLNLKQQNVADLMQSDRLSAVSVPRQRHKTGNELVDKKSSVGKSDTITKNLKVNSSMINKELKKNINFSNEIFPS